MILNGLKVIDLSRIMAGPLAAQYLADHGADVVHNRTTRANGARPSLMMELPDTTTRSTGTNAISALI